MVHWWPLDQSNPKDVLEIACITRTVVCNVTWTFFILFSNCEILIFFELWLSDPIVPLILAKQSQYNFWLPLAGTYSTVFWYSLEICISPPHLPNSPIQSLYCSALWNNLPNPEGRVLETLEEVWNSGVQEIFLFFPDLRFFLNVRFYDSIASSWFLCTHTQVLIKKLNMLWKCTVLIQIKWMGFELKVFSFLVEN